MLTVGQLKTISVRTRNRQTKKLEIVCVNGVPQTKTVPSEVWRVTKEPLDRSFLRDGGRRLKVGLINGDLLVLCPEGTRVRMSVRLADVYRILLRNAANNAVLERARAKKSKLQAQRESRRIQREDRRLSRNIAEA